MSKVLRELTGPELDAVAAGALVDVNVDHNNILDNSLNNNRVAVGVNVLSQLTNVSA